MYTHTSAIYNTAVETVFTTQDYCSPISERHQSIGCNYKSMHIYIICIYVRPSEPQLKLDTVGTAEKRSPETSDSPSAAMDEL